MYNFLFSLISAFLHIIFRVEIIGKENVPKDGGGIICANHISNWDPLFLQAASRRRIYFMAKEELFHVFFLKLILKYIKAIPVKRTGSDLAAVKLSLKTIKNGDILGIFPTGQREKSKGEGEVKAGVGMIAGKTEVPVVPVHIVADYRIFSKVKVIIGEPKVYAPSDGAKMDAELARCFSEDIYKTIKSL